MLGRAIRGFLKHYLCLLDSPSMSLPSTCPPTDHPPQKLDFSSCVKRTGALASMSSSSGPPAIFRRGMAWKAKRDAKVAKARKEQAQGEGGMGMSFSSEIYGATVGEHIDAYHRYNMIVGESDGGNPLPEAEYKALERRCAAAAKDRLFVTWRNALTGMDCVNVGPMTRCFCGHSFRAHAFYENKTKNVHCRVPGCRCRCYEYVYHRASSAVRCRCKHELADHRDKYGRSRPCERAGCGCQQFVATVTCTCGAPATDHVTAFERRSERDRDGRVTQSLWQQMENLGRGDSDGDGGGRALTQGVRTIEEGKATEELGLGGSSTAGTGRTDGAAGGALQRRRGGGRHQQLRQQQQRRPLDDPSNAPAGSHLPTAYAAMAAGAGGLTSFLSLAPGSERVLVDRSSALPMRRVARAGSPAGSVDKNELRSDRRAVTTTATRASRGGAWAPARSKGRDLQVRK